MQKTRTETTDTGESGTEQEGGEWGTDSFEPENSLTHNPIGKSNFGGLNSFGPYSKDSVGSMGSKLRRSWSDWIWFPCL